MIVGVNISIQKERTSLYISAIVALPKRFDWIDREPLPCINREFATYDNYFKYPQVLTWHFINVSEQIARSLIALSFARARAHTPLARLIYNRNGFLKRDSCSNRSLPLFFSRFSPTISFSNEYEVIRPADIDLPRHELWRIFAELFPIAREREKEREALFILLEIQ